MRRLLFILILSCPLWAQIQAGVLGAYTISGGVLARSGSAVVANDVSGNATATIAATSGSESVAIFVAFRDDSSETITAPAGYTCPINVGGVSAHYTGAICFQANVSAGTTAVTVTKPANAADWCLVVQKYTGVTASPLDQSATFANNVSTNYSSNPVTTTVANELLLGGLISGSSGVTFTPTNSWSLVGGCGVSTRVAGLQDRIVSSTGSYQAMGTVSTGDVDVAIVTLKGN